MIKSAFFRLITVLCILLIGLNFAMAQNKTGIFDNHTDIGDCKHPGFASYNSNNQSYTIGGSVSLPVDNTSGRFYFARRS
jgi:ATP sulfurylase